MAIHCSFPGFGEPTLPYNKRLSPQKAFSEVEEALSILYSFYIGGDDFGLRVISQVL